MQGHANLLTTWFNLENVGNLPGICGLMRAEMAALYLRYPDQQYIIIDQGAEDHDTTVTVETVPGSIHTELWKWESLNEGDGVIHECSFPHGQGLRITSEDLLIFVVPLKILADGWVTATPVRTRRKTDADPPLRCDY